MKRKAAIAFKGIPANERGQVRQLVHIYAGLGKTYSPAKVWEMVQIDRLADAKRKEEESARVAKENKRYRHERARKDIPAAINKLATIRDMLKDTAEGDGPFDAQDCAMVAHAVLVESVSEIEQALFDIGLITGSEHSTGEIEGMFVELLAKDKQS